MLAKRRECRNCGGDGYLTESYNGSHPCPACDGEGWVIETTNKKLEEEN